ncbi:phosphoglycerate mutase [Candidatus Bathyarchaeota archaeon]|nr:MAG: phosphoglycerate mutase [Candidatus Bathyarchaeota archaeon]
MPDKRAVLIIVDGMGDRPLIDHDYKTPLEYANTPNMDRLAKGGLVGSLDPISPGVRPGSDVANLALLGYDPARYYTGRGALEALGAGIDLRPNDVAFRVNFATVDDDFRVEDRRAGRIRKGASKLAKSVSEIKVESTTGVKTIFKPTVEHRAVLVLRGEKLSRHVTDTDPGEEGLKLVISRATDGSDEAKRTAAAVNEFVKRSHEVLRDHPLNQERANDGEKPANIILTRGAGTSPSLPSLVHVKAPDIAGHDADFKGKVRALEDVDGLVGHVIDEVDIGANYVALTSDHATPVGYGYHTGDPVPLVIGGPDVPASRVLKLSEASASRGNIGRIRGIDLMPVLTDLMGRSRLYGS